MKGKNPRAIIIAGSLGGVFAANMLREVCLWDLEVFGAWADEAPSASS